MIEKLRSKSKYEKLRLKFRVFMFYFRRGTVSRDDFDTLCEVLELRRLSRPPSCINGAPSNYRLSGIEWLSSYRPRSPLSPLRVDKLNEVKYRGPKRPLDKTDGGHESQQTVCQNARAKMSTFVGYSRVRQFF